MGMTDPVADLLTRIRNGSRAQKPAVDVPSSKLKKEIVRILKEHNFVRDMVDLPDNKQGILRVSLKYQQGGSPVLTGLKRVSKPSLRVYNGRKALQQVRSGLGISIITTSKGVMTGKEARRQQIGGEVLCEVW